MTVSEFERFDKSEKSKGQNVPLIADNAAEYVSEKAGVATASTSQPRCEFCGDRQATIGGRWCSLRHRIDGERELATAPSPEQIAARAAEIRAGWSPATLADRWQGPRREEWDLATVDDAELAAAVEDSR